MKLHADSGGRETERIALGRAWRSVAEAVIAGERTGTLVTREALTSYHIARTFETAEDSSPTLTARSDPQKEYHSKLELRNGVQ